MLTPAGLDKSVGLITAVYFMDPADPQWKNDPAFKAYKAWFDKYYPEGDINDGFNVAGYVIAAGRRAGAQDVRRRSARART